jgi:hypothetical protein
MTRGGRRRILLAGPASIIAGWFFIGTGRRMRQLNLRKSLLIAAVGLSAQVVVAEPFAILNRPVVDMPPNAATALRGEMVDLLGAMRQVFALSGQGKNIAAADLAERLIGRTAMAQHGGNVRPGMFMPPEMRAMAQMLHQNASDWSFALRTGDRQRADAAFAQVLGSCAGCHQSFQLRRP